MEGMKQPMVNGTFYFHINLMLRAQLSHKVKFKFRARRAIK
jgi:hypothetical protein